MLFTDKKINIHYTAIMAVYWTLNAIATSYLTPLLQGRGYSNMEIGILYLIKSLTIMFGQPILADFADRNVKTVPLKYITAGILVISMGLTILFLCYKMKFIYMAILFGAMGVSFYCINPCIDSLAMQFINKGRNINYSLARAFGSLGWAIGSVLTGYIVILYGMESMLKAEILTMIVLILIVVMYETYKVNGSSEKTEDLGEQVHTVSFILLHYPRYFMFLLAFGILYIGQSFGNYYMINIVRYLGADEIYLGYIQFVLAVSEVPVGFFFVKYKMKLGINKVVVLCTIFATLRYIGMLISPNAYLLIASQIFQMLGFGVFWSSSIYFVMDNIPHTDIVKGQSMINLVLQGIGSGLGAMLGGAILDYLNIKYLLAVTVGFGVLSIVIIVIGMKMPKSATKEDT